MSIMTKEIQEKMTPSEAVERLIEGNKRFVSQNLRSRDPIERARIGAMGQFPFAVTLSCIDSRSTMEQIFDQGIGDIFNNRVAGNIINKDILGSLEFACAVAGSKLIAVIGHSQCGAIKGACDNVKLGNLTHLLEKIQLSVQEEKTTLENRDSTNSEFVEKVSLLNVKKSVQQIMEQSSILKELIESGKVGIVGATHNISTGHIEFHKDTFNIN